MADLTASDRDHMAATSFALRSKRAYPINDPEHARLALAMGSKYASPSELATIKSAVASRYPGIDQAGS